MFQSIICLASLLVFGDVTILLMEEILHLLIGNLSHYLHGFIHPRWLAGFLPSTVLLTLLIHALKSLS